MDSDVLVNSRIIFSNIILHDGWRSLPGMFWRSLFVWQVFDNGSSPPTIIKSVQWYLNKVHNIKVFLKFYVYYREYLWTEKISANPWINLQSDNIRTLNNAKNPNPHIKGQESANLLSDCHSWVLDIAYLAQTFISIKNYELDEIFYDVFKKGGGVNATLS